VGEWGVIHEFFHTIRGAMGNLNSLRIAKKLTQPGEKENRMKPTIGFVGLGTMGKWMAINLVKKGFPLNFFARKKEAVEMMGREGGKYLPSLKGLARESDWLIFCVSDTEAVEEVLFGKEGMAEELRPGQIVIDCGTIHPLPTRRFAETLKAKGVPFLDAPISGMEARAKAGTLTIMVGGVKEVFERTKSVFEAMGNKIIYAGQSGNGQLMKMINQVMFDIHCATIAELLPLAVKMGLDAEQTLEVVKSGTGQCFAVENFGPLILDRNFGPGYPLEDAYNDMVHVAEISSAHRVPLPVTAGCMLTYQMALDQGLGRENKGAMIKVWEKALGVEVRKA
jgi:3-hydroxyisobutyrate dehydrogenase-like beta-hydroxyacid dehydrogenase